MARNHKFDVEPSTTVLELKKRFCQDTSWQDLYALCLVLNGEELEEDKKTLSDYNIANDCQFDAVYIGKTYRGENSFMGSRFLDITNDKALQRIEWGVSGKPWWKTIRGLCLEGICTNSDCEAYRECVIMRIGYKKFDMLNDPDEHTTVCPMCQNYVEPVTIAFNNCWWRYEGTRHAKGGAGKPAVRCSNDWQKADDAYHRFSETKAGTVLWKRLIIEVVKDKPI